MKDGMIFPFKKTWRSRLDLEYLDETSGRKVAARLDQSRLEDGANPNEIGKKLRQFADYASKETLGQVHAGGFLHHRIVLNPDGSPTSPMALSNSERKKGSAQYLSWPEGQMFKSYPRNQFLINVS